MYVLLVSETKIDGTFPLVQFCVEDYSIPYRRDREHVKDAVYCCM